MFINIIYIVESNKCNSAEGCGVRLLRIPLQIQEALPSLVCLKGAA